MEGISELQFIKCLASHLQHLSQMISVHHLEETRKTDTDNDDPETEGESLHHQSTSSNVGLTNSNAESRQQQSLREQVEPKKPISSFVFYFRDQLQHPSKEKEVGKLAKIISEQWRALPAEAKHPYALMAQQSQRVYHESMHTYNTEHAAEIQQNQKLKRIANNKMRCLKRKKANSDGLFRKKCKKNKRKDSGPDIGIKKPKLPLSSFFIFFRESLARISQTHKQNRRSRLVQLASDQWKAMTRQQKQRYESIAKVNKQTYAQQLEEYTARASEYFKNKAQPSANITKNSPEGSSDDKKEKDISMNADKVSESGSEQAGREPDSLGIDDVSSSSSICDQELSSSSSYVEEYTPKEDPSKQSPSGKKGKRGKRNKQTHEPKGPVSSFFLYYNCAVRELKQKYPKQKGSELVKIASERWALFPEEEKEIYQEEARRGRQLYDIEMSKYKKEYPEEASRVKYFQTKKEK